MKNYFYWKTELLGPFGTIILFPFLFTYRNDNCASNGISEIKNKIFLSKNGLNRFITKEFVGYNRSFLWVF